MTRNLPGIQKKKNVFASETSYEFKETILIFLENLYTQHVVSDDSRIN